MFLFVLLMICCCCCHGWSVVSDGGGDGDGDGGGVGDGGGEESGVGLQGISVNCTKLTSCTTCLSRNCSWCPLLDQCMEGNQLDLFGGDTDNCGWWLNGDINACVNEDPCLPFTSCKNCTEQKSCGWCGAVCVSGNGSGPYDSSLSLYCPWMWKLSSCKSPPCRSFNTCTACIKQKYPSPINPTSGCLWCDDQCLNAPPSPNISICTSWSWDRCNNSENNCSVHTDCQSCNRDKSLDCGWCQSSKLCHNAKERDICCTDWRYGTCQKSCYAIRDCTICTNTSYCGMCGSSFCTVGTNTTQPAYFPQQFCSPWSHKSCDFNRCSRYSTNCSYCLSAGCHYCQSEVEGNMCKSDFSFGCCSSCDNCGQSNVHIEYFLRVSVGLLSAAALIVGGLLIVSCGYAYWKYYWSRRHYFEVLK